MIFREEDTRDDVSKTRFISHLKVFVVINAWEGSALNDKMHRIVLYLTGPLPAHAHTPHYLMN